VCGVCVVCVCVCVCVCNVEMLPLGLTFSNRSALCRHCRLWMVFGRRWLQTVSAASTVLRDLSHFVSK